MGLLPGYATLGPSSCVILVILRMVQGLSVGGQLAGSYVMSIEQSTIHNRGFRGSVCDASSVREIQIFLHIFRNQLILISYLACLFCVNKGWRFSFGIIGDNNCENNL